MQGAIADQEQFGVQCLAQAQFNVQLGGAGIRTFQLFDDLLYLLS